MDSNTLTRIYRVNPEGNKSMKKVNIAGIMYIIILACVLSAVVGDIFCYKNMAAPMRIGMT